MGLIEGIAALVAKAASASTIAQSAAGLGIAVAGVTGAGAAGVLPAPVQDTVAGAVEAVTPFTMPHAAPDHTAVERHPSGDEARPGPAAVPTTTSPAPAVTTAEPTTTAPAPAVATAEPTDSETDAEHSTGNEDGPDDQEGTEATDGADQHRDEPSGTTVPATDSPEDAPETAGGPHVDDHGSGDTPGQDGEGDRTTGGSGHDGGSGNDGD